MMRKINFLCLFLMIGLGMTYAQDVITKRSGEDINAKILEVTQTEIKYKKFDNQTGPTFTLAISDVFMVKYENGTKDVFEKTTQQNASPYGGTRNSNTSVPPGIEPGMSYKYYKDFYKNRTYVSRIGDQYSPAVAGICSFLIPGLGQAVCGEVGRGLGFFGGVFGCYVLSGVGSSLIGSGDPTAGAVLVLAGAVGSLTIGICSIVDAVKVAKIKNMYEQDVRKMTTAIDLKLSPYIETVSIGGQQITPVGLRLSMTF